MIADLYRFAIALGLVSVPLAAVSVALFARGRLRRVGAAFVVGLLCAVPAYMIGVSYFCLSEHVGNLRGLGAIFGTAPLGFSLGALSCALLSRAILAKPKQGASSRSGS
jgi:hypothetical protein